MDKKTRHAQKDSPRGIFYQVLVAIKYAAESELWDFENLTLEDTGDVSFDNLYQIETKHHTSKHSLGDKHEDFWKTIYNWSTQEDKFDKLILHTTSYFPTKSLLKNWKSSNKC